MLYFPVLGVRERDQSIMRAATALLLCLILTALLGCGSSSSGGGTKTTQPPIANAGGPYSGMPGVAVNLSGTKSTDPQGETLTYEWEYGDGTTGTGVSTTHIYTATGTYNLSLTVTDTSNLSSTASTTAAINAQPPMANAGGRYSGVPGVAVTFNGSGSTDPQNEALSYAWNFGDGTTGSGISTTHAYSAVGTYNISLTVTDTSNLTSTAGTTGTD